MQTHYSASPITTVAEGKDDFLMITNTTLVCSFEEAERNLSFDSSILDSSVQIQEQNSHI